MLYLQRIRIFLYIALSLVFIWTSSNSIQRLQRKDMSRTTTVMQEDDSDWPSMTLCIFPVTLDNLSYVDQIKALPPAGDIFRSRYLELAIPPVNRSVSVKVRQWLAAKSYGGLKSIHQCFTTDTKLNRNIISGRVTFSLTIPLMKGRAAQLLVHDQGFHSFLAPDLPGMTFLPVQNEYPLVKAMVFTKKIIEEMNLKSRPCDVTSSQRLTKCMHQFMDAAVGCKLMWNDDDDLQDSAKSNNRSCSTEVDFDRFDSMSTSLGSTMDEVLRATGCRRNCRYGKYSLESIYESRNLFSNSSEYHLMSLDKETTMETQVFSYGLSDFVADFGGYLGLLLGASVLSVYDQLVMGCRRVKRQVKSRILKV